MTQTFNSLAEQIGQSVQDFITSLPVAERESVMQSFEKLGASNIADKAINTGDTAPDFVLQNARGEVTRLYETLTQGPVVLSFYRGGWCPFCNLELKALQQHMPEMKAQGATLLAISPETPDNSLTTAERLQLEFEVLSDPGNRITRDYGLLFTIYEEMRPLYLRWGLNVPAYNGDDHWEVPVPATYLIDTHRTVRAAHVDKDYTKRMEPEYILEILGTLT